MNETPSPTSSSSRSLAYLLGGLLALLVVGIICATAFGVGYVAGHIQTPSLDAITAALPVVPDSDALSPTDDPSGSGEDVSPANFDVFWEALDHFRESFNGEVPDDSEITFAAVEGLLAAAGTCDTSPEDDLTLSAPQSPREAPANFDFFWETASELLNDCGEPRGDDITYAAVNGITDRLGDRFTGLLPPARAESFRIELESSFEGIGASVLDAENGGAEIIQPFVGSPAEQAGLRKGDIIIAVDGADITGLTLDEAVRLIRGPAGSQVTLTISRADESDEPFDVEVTRGRIDIPVLESRILPENIQYIALYEFSASAADRLKEALSEGEAQGVDGVILDLRGNPGGRLDIAIDVASLFIPSGVIVSEKGQRNFEHRTSLDAVAPDVPLAVLVDGGSASASEIVAGAVQDAKRGALVGERTYGKGSVQSLFDLTDGSLLRVTSARWFTPSGRQIDGQGLEPDIRASIDPNQADDDAQLQAAIDYLQGLKQQQ